MTSSLGPSCGGDFRSRLRALEQLERGSAVCRVQLLGGLLQPRPQAEIEAADLADRQWRKRARALGVSELSGPPALRGVMPVVGPFAVVIPAVSGAG